MNSIPIIILPGLDGSDLLLQQFLALAPPNRCVKILSIPDDSRADYDSLTEQFSSMIGPADCHIIAESFSGPIGILLAHRFPAVVSRLTLVSSFASTPTPGYARYLPWSLLFRIPIPGFVAKRYFLGPKSALIPTLRAAIRIPSVATLVQRIRCVMKVNVTDELAGLECQIDYVRPSKDRLVPEWIFRNLLKVKPDIKVFSIEGPHLIMQTKPEETWAAILDRP